MKGCGGHVRLGWTDSQGNEAGQVGHLGKQNEDPRAKAMILGHDVLR